MENIREKKYICRHVDRFITEYIKNMYFAKFTLFFPLQHERKTSGVGVKQFIYSFRLLHVKVTNAVKQNNPLTHQ